MYLPQAIQSYFEADKKSDCQAVIDCFADDAVVHDEGRSHLGQYAIGTWWEQSKAKYRHVTEPLEASEHGDVTKIRAKVTGRFPGSPATLTFAFSLVDEKIAALEIGA